MQDITPVVEQQPEQKGSAKTRYGVQILTVSLPRYAGYYESGDSERDSDLDEILQLIQRDEPVEVDRELANSWRNGHVIMTPWGGKLVAHAGRPINELRDRPHYVSLTHLISEFGHMPVFVIYKVEEGKNPTLEIRPGVPSFGKVLKQDVTYRVLDILSGWRVPIEACWINPRDDGSEVCNLRVEAKPISPNAVEGYEKADIGFSFENGRLYVEMPYETSRQINRPGGRAEVRKLQAKQAGTGGTRALQERPPYMPGSRR